MVESINNIFNQECVNRCICVWQKQKEITNGGSIDALQEWYISYQLYVFCYEIFWIFKVFISKHTKMISLG
uniref:Uncharacterized protein n=1 Tax=Nelumbo nucifera TaxID=4432 RepID=A0A822YK86_NELNU|nr:TPA_asm: hypothetical protein HUJ06_011861 [Nelumbo nucifera]